MKIHELKYSNTNTYLIEGSKGKVLFDTGWAGSFPAFCKNMGEIGIAVQEIDILLISHFHPDHMGIAQEIASCGAVITVAEVQREYLHSADSVFAKEKNAAFRKIEDERVHVVPIEETRELLKNYGINGELLHTPGHSDDSISLWLDEGILFVGDLNPLYERKLHEGTQIGESWRKLLALSPHTVYYGHAAPARLSAEKTSRFPKRKKEDHYLLVAKIMKYIDKGMGLDRIADKTGADKDFINDVARMYLTHPHVGVQGILDRIEIKNK